MIIVSGTSILIFIIRIKTSLEEIKCLNSNIQEFTDKQSFRTGSYMSGLFENYDEFIESTFSDLPISEPMDHSSNIYKEQETIIIPRNYCLEKRRSTVFDLPKEDKVKNNFDIGKNLLKSSSNEITGPNHTQHSSTHYIEISDDEEPTAAISTSLKKANPLSNTFTIQTIDTELYSNQSDCCEKSSLIEEFRKIIVHNNKKNYILSITNQQYEEAVKLDSNIKLMCLLEKLLSDLINDGLLQTNIEILFYHYTNQVNLLTQIRDLLGIRIEVKIDAILTDFCNVFRKVENHKNSTFDLDFDFKILKCNSHDITLATDYKYAHLIDNCSNITKLKNGMTSLNEIHNALLLNVRNKSKNIKNYFSNRKKYRKNKIHYTSLELLATALLTRKDDSIGLANDKMHKLFAEIIDTHSQYWCVMFTKICSDFLALDFHYDKNLHLSNSSDINIYRCTLKKLYFYYGIFNFIDTFLYSDLCKKTFNAQRSAKIW